MNKMTTELTDLLQKLQASEINLQVNNEELQAAVEELATMNEEFYALNDELEAKNEELEKLSLLARYTHELVIITDKHQQIEWVNEAFEKLTGYTLYEVKGKKPSFLQGKDTNPEHIRNLREGILRKEPFQQEILNYGKRGNEYWLLISITPVFDAEGNIQKFVAVELDMTSQKEQERRLNELNTQNTSLQQFSYIVSHNLRSNVANLLGLTELIKDETSYSEDLQGYLQLLTKTVKGLDNTITDLNEILHLRNDINKVYRQFRWAELVEEVQEELLPQIVAKKVDFQYVITHETIKTVKSYCKSIVINLVSNAIKYSSPARKPIISVKITQIAPKQHQITVQDNGLGIDLDKYGANLFGMYKRFHTEQEGKGLGLYIVKNQVDILGGAISIASEVNEGSTFTVVLPSH